jgi:hypothetical protein
VVEKEEEKTCETTLLFETKVGGGGGFGDGGQGGDVDGGQGKVVKEQIAKEKRKALEVKSAGTQHRHPRGSCCKKAVLMLLLGCCWKPHNSGFGFRDRPPATLGRIHLVLGSPAHGAASLAMALQRIEIC